MSRDPYLIVKGGKSRVNWLTRAPLIPEAKLILNLSTGQRVGGKARDNDVAGLVAKAKDVVELAMREYGEKLVRPLLPA